jgi:hypothetical protein
MSVAETLDTVLEKVKSLVQAESVVGKPIQAPDGSPSSFPSAGSRWDSEAVAAPNRKARAWPRARARW